MTYAIQIIVCLTMAFLGIVFSGVGGLFAERNEENAARVACVLSAFLITLAILVRP